MTDTSATSTRVLTLAPAMPSPDGPTWSGAAWVGAVDRAEALAADAVALAGAAGFRRARLLVRDGLEVAGFVDVAVDADGDLDPAELGPALRAVRATGLPAAPTGTPVGRVSVVIGTRDRPEDVRRCVRSVLASAYDDLEVLVVDNAPSSTATRDVVAAVGDPRVRYVLEARPGVSRARNAGLALATGEVVAFVDDDVVVDRDWASALAAAYARDADVVCVTGLVPSGELRTPTQRYFDERVTWARNTDRRVFRTASPPADLPLFPFSVGAFGTGANMSIRRDAGLALGGFDVALGPGTPTRAGEDPDLFTRVLFSGGALAVEPSAVVWHRHRSDREALRAQALGYGTGLGAWVAKLVLRPRTAVAVLRRAVGALRQLGALGQGNRGGGAGGAGGSGGAGGAGGSGSAGGAGADQVTAAVAAIAAWPVDDDFRAAAAGLQRVELVAALGGPWRYLVSRARARR
ncbi:glycosyltransferase family 2 protein [Curtobacterium sp. MCBA15_004]|uniref:glycosyltransferase family 2 protein n=1 Tax=unclassified Curtobacterium TaxID=257496 RepID=UPI0008DC8431|nr:glycosyltransferase [Curtobacterium sp. MCBA15_004]WIA95576.1 glycosyltransferase [Curtobacterium sp. MCBA15_004]